MERHNSCVNTRAIITYVEYHYGRGEELLQGVDELLVGVSNPLDFLKDVNNWVSSEVVGRLFANARVVADDPEVARKIGYESVTQKKLGYIQHILLRALGSPRGTLKQLKAINDKFNLNKEIDLVHLGWDHATVRLRWRPDLELSRDFCLMNQGVYSALTTIWGVPPALVKETRCQFHGSEYCEFELRWKNPSLWQRVLSLGRSRRRLLDDTLAELERDKHLLHQKFSEVTALNQSLQHKIDQLISIQQASGAILSELEYQKLYPTVLKLFVHAIGYNRGMIMLLDQETETLRYVEGVGVSPKELKVLDGYAVPLSRRHNLLARVAASGQPMLCEDTSDLGLNPDNPIIRKWKPKSIVVLPLMAQGRVIGLLAADRHGEHRAIPRLDRDYLQVFANQVALALENARMYRNLRESFLSTVQALALALEAKDTYTRGHSERVTQYAVRLAERLPCAWPNA
jgi:two-component system, cell cycle sensor histidine kinase and response regulator CckA